MLVLAGRIPGIPPEAEGILVSAGYLAALAALWFNRAIAWCPAVLTGTALNAIVIIANGGRMPVLPDTLGRAAAAPAVVDSLHVLATGSTRFALLGDSVPLRLGRLGLVASPGDLVMAVGIAGLLQAAMRAEDSSR